MDPDNNKIEEEKEHFEPLEHSMQDYFDQHLKPYSKLIVLKPYGAVLVEGYDQHHQNIKSYPGKATDVWVATYPKCGTTWTQELVWCLVRGFDHKDGKKPLMERFPFFEWDTLFNKGFQTVMDANLPPDHHERPGGQWKILEAQEDPRLIKTHLLYQLLPRDVEKQGAKIIYVVRDPRDVCVSFFYHSKKLINYTGDFDNFVQLFLRDLFVFGPYWANILGFWNARHSGNILFLTYENMKEDLPAAIRQVADFLKISVSDDKVSQMTKHLQFDSMKKNPATNNEGIMDKLTVPSDVKFMRKGIVGDYKNHLTEVHLKQFDEWTDKWLKGSDFPHYRKK